ncbi:MAG: S8 family serine peptidase [Verrucomicrobia bacterium]|nr:S8 family serine peptidase [Verrucomicrobiota bacterium]
MLSTRTLSLYCFLPFLAATTRFAIAQTDFIAFGNTKIHPQRILARLSDGNLGELAADKIHSLGLQIEHEFQLIPGLLVLSPKTPDPISDILTPTEFDWPAFHEPPGGARLLSSPDFLASEDSRARRESRPTAEQVHGPNARGNRLEASHERSVRSRRRNDSDTLAKIEIRLRSLRESGLFDYVEPDYLIMASQEPSDARYLDGVLWGLRNQGLRGGVAGADIEADRAWDITTGSTNVIVAVVDSGIRYTHQELLPQMWRNPGEVPGNGLDDDTDGYPDNVFGIDAINRSGDPFDDGGHGTHVAGIIGAAANDGYPHVGVAWQVRLMACKFLALDGFGLTSDAIRCLDFAVNKGARIINASWVSGPYSASLFEAIARARASGVLFVAAAGNGGLDLDQSPSYPAAFELDNVISVAALDRSDRLDPSCNFGRARVHLGAAGVEILSTAAQGDQAYSMLSGSSMAAPYVSGVAALLLAQFPDALIPELRNRILLTVVPLENLSGKLRTGGRLNAYRALTARPDGLLEISVFPEPGSSLRAGSAAKIQITVTDLEGITNATLRARLQETGEVLAFHNDGKGADGAADAATYSAMLSGSNDRFSLTLDLHIDAPGKSALEQRLTYFLLAPAQNDDFAQAARVSPSGGVFYTTNKLATIEPGEPLHAGAPASAASVWWQWTPANDTSVIVDSSGSTFDTVLAVYTNATLPALRLVASADDSDTRKQGYVIFDAIGGVTYHIAVAGNSQTELGTVRLRIQPRGGPDDRAPEIMITSPFSGLTVTNATDNRIVVTGTAVDSGPNASGVEAVLVTVNAGEAGRAFGTANWSSTNTLELGENTIQVVAMDAAHNASPPRYLTIFYQPLLLSNDLFAQSAELFGRKGTVRSDSTAATGEFGEPLHAGVRGGKSAWWHFHAAADGLLSLSTENSAFDTVLALYSGSHVTNLTLIVANDDARANVTYSEIKQAIKALQTYRIAVDGRGNNSGAIQLTYSFTPAEVFRLSLAATAGGSVIPPSGFYAKGAPVVVQAVPQPDYDFGRWEGTLESIENPRLLMITNDVELVARFHPHEFSDGFESGAFGKLNWASRGDAPWTVQTQVVSSGSSAARSGAIGHGQASALLLIGACRAGDGSFRLRVSSEERWDFLEFYLNGRRVQRWSGEISWTACEFSVPPGVNTFEWRYSKDAGGRSAGLDAGYIDDLEIPLAVPIDGTTPARLDVIPLDAQRFHLQVRGQTKQQYVIQSSPDLRDWVPYSTNVATNGIILRIETVSTNAGIRFYRAVMP